MRPAKPKLLGQLRQRLRSRHYSGRTERTGEQGPYHVHDSIIRRAAKEAVARSRPAKRATCHTSRRSSATHLLDSGTDTRTVQELLGHKDLATMMIYTNVLDCGPAGVRSPIDLT